MGVDATGQAQLSYRGSTQVFGSDQLAMWIRDPAGGLPSALPANPRLTLMYRDPAKRVTYQFYGRGRVVDDAAVRTTVFDSSPERERNFDPERRGELYPLYHRLRDVAPVHRTDDPHMRGV